MKSRDYSTLIGLFFVFAIIYYSLFLNNSIAYIFNLSSFLLVFACTLAVCYASFSFKIFRDALRNIVSSLFSAPQKPKMIALDCMELAQIIYNSSLRKFLKSEDNKNLKNEFFIKWSEYILDAEDVKIIDSYITEEIETHKNNKKKVIEFLQKAYEVAPAFGLIGTILGLIQMLSSIEDTAAITSGMASALLTTLYGAILAYCFFQPISNKLENNLNDEVINMKIIHKTIISLREMENPRLLESSLNTLLPDGSKIIYYKYE